MPKQKTKNKKRIKKKGGENKTYTKNEAIKKIKDDYDKFLKMLQDKYNIYVDSDLVTSSERIQKINLFKEMCKEEGIEPSDIDLFIPHQANMRIIEAARERLELPLEKCFVNIDML